MTSRHLVPARQEHVPALSLSQSHHNWLPCGLSGGKKPTYEIHDSGNVSSPPVYDVLERPHRNTDIDYTLPFRMLFGIVAVPLVAKTVIGLITALWHPATH